MHPNDRTCRFAGSRYRPATFCFEMLSLGGTGCQWSLALCRMSKIGVWKRSADAFGRNRRSSRGLEPSRWRFLSPGVRDAVVWHAVCVARPHDRAGSRIAAKVRERLKRAAPGPVVPDGGGGGGAAFGLPVVGAARCGKTTPALRFRNVAGSEPGRGPADALFRNRQPDGHLRRRNSARRLRARVSARGSPFF